ncbi:restriction endonuclease [Mycolicibacterium llatzerense]|uniref:restriction endonuclease n=1 Tax=Mycolicibacterium llatzerense TaxID=280871 RepID=UPI0008DC60BF|nr:restriction endonuclease [Mycolicibacterium llatzerense]
MSIKWEHLEQPEFDRIVGALFARRFKDTGTVTVVDGRGGDDGVDIQLDTHDGHRRIFQLKYFPQGFSSGWGKTRRPQIRKSYKAALEHKPDEWTLVIPRDLTTPEREFVESLNGGTEPPAITIVGRNELVDWLADDPSLDTSLQRGPETALREMATTYNMESAALQGGWNDVAQRVRNLGDVVDSVDPDWTIDFARVGGTDQLTVRPQHPLAAERNPIGVKIQTRPLDEIDAALREHIERTLGYGSSTPVVIPGEAVESVTVTGPEFLAGNWPAGEVHLGPFPYSPSIGKRIDLRIRNDGEVVASYEGIVTHAGSGEIGGTIDASFFDGRLTMAMRMPHDPDLTQLHADKAHQPGVDLTVAYGPDAPQLVADVLFAARSIRSSSQLEIHVEGEHAATLGGFPPITIDDYAQDLLSIEQYAEDLAIVQRHCKQHFGIPQYIQPGERVAMRVARLLVEGHVVASPKARIFTVALGGDDSPDLRAALSTPRPIGWQSPNPHTVTAGDRTLTIGHVHVVHPRAVVDNLTEVIAALDAGNGKGFHVDYRPERDPFFHLVLATGAAPLDLRGKQIARWSLHGITQPGLPGDLASDPNPAPTPADT